MVCLYNDIKKDLKKHYSGEGAKIANQFYIPVLQRSTKYRRLSGYFSVNSLVISAVGLVGLVNNGGNMELIVGAHDISPELVEAFEMSTERAESLLEEFGSKIIAGLEDVEDLFATKRLEALAWMLAAKTLEIKVAIPKKTYYDMGNGIFHEKLIMMEDNDGCSISAVGSANETYQAYKDNGESLWLDMSWLPGGDDNVYDKVEYFQIVWNDDHPDYFIFSLPDAVEKKIHERFWRPDPPIVESDDVEYISSITEKKTEIKLFDHQKKAIDAWFQNDKKGIFEMATGTGKTFTALGCLQRLFENEAKLVAIIACPYDHLVRQWAKSIAYFNIDSDIIIADSSNSGWKDQLADHMLDIKIGLADDLIVLTTHTTLSSDDFVKLITIGNTKLFLIADEVHGLGAPKRQNGLIEEYNYRLGLSATPKRWFDSEGTNALYEYFHETVFEFTLEDALNTINPDTGLTYLTPYEYKPHFVGLNDDELEEYEKITHKIIKSYAYAKKNDTEDIMALLSIKRQKIVKNAINKYDEFRNILSQLGEVKHCLIYCAPEQMQTVQDIISSEFDIIHHKFTMAEKVRPEKKYGSISEREFLLKNFTDGTYGALLAMKCLDEGVDVPSAKTSIILASSGNPREYIQRAGRVLRRHPSKDKSIIHDIVVIPILSIAVDPEFMELEKKIIRKELRRYKEFAKYAINKLECLIIIEKIEGMYKIYDGGD